MNRTLVGILFTVGIVTTTLSIIINNLLMPTCGAFLSWWVGIMISMLLWSWAYSILENKFPSKD